MKSKFLILLLLVGCSSNPKIETVTKIERVVVKPPMELLIIPAPIIAIDIDHATQRTVAEWLIKNEERTMRMEQQLIGLKKWTEEVK